jgi:hypothetical protein
MPKHGGNVAFFLVDGYNFLSAAVKNISLKRESITEQVDGLGDAYEAHAPVGKERATLTQGGAFYDTSTLGLHSAMAAGTPTSPQATPRVICLGAMLGAVGSLFYGIQGTFTVAYEVVLEMTKLSKANVQHAVSGKIEPGMVIQPLATKTADWNTKTLSTVVDYTLDPAQVTVPITSNSIANPSVVTTTVPHGLTTGDIILIAGVSTSSPTINGQRTVTVISTTTFSVPVNVTVAGTGGSFVRANSSNGCAGYQQISALSGFSGFVGKIRDSADDITYADLCVFVNVTAAPNAQRVTAAGVVDRYVSYDGDVTGSGSITAFSALSRL